MIDDEAVLGSNAVGEAGRVRQIEVGGESGERVDMRHQRGMVFVADSQGAHGVLLRRLTPDRRRPPATSPESKGTNPPCEYSECPNGSSYHQPATWTWIAGERQRRWVPTD
jgi:hypothetical protein